MKKIDIRSLVIYLVIILIFGTVFLLENESSLFLSKNRTTSLMYSSNEVLVNEFITNQVLANEIESGTVDGDPDEVITTSSLKVGDLIKYDTGNTEVGDNGLVTCIVMYNDEQHGLQVTPTQTLGTVSIGGETLNEAKESYNNAIITLNQEARKYFNSDYAIDYRSVGSVGTVDENGMFANKNSEGEAYQSEYTVDILTNIPQLQGLKDGDTNRSEDISALIAINSFYIGDDDQYWLASRKVGGVSGGYLDSNTTHLIFKMTVCYDNNNSFGLLYGADEEEIIHSTKTTSNEMVYNETTGEFENPPPQYAVRQQNKTNKFRPVYSLKRDLFIKSGNGEEQPYVVEKKDEEHNPATVHDLASALQVGDIVKYDTGNTEVGENGIVECIVLYNDEQHGVQITPTQTLGKVNIGSETFDIAKEDYNMAILKLTGSAGRYFNSDYAIDYRCIGSIPTVLSSGYFDSKNEEAPVVPAEFSPDIYANLPQLQGLKGEDINYVEDTNALKAINSFYLGEDNQYWLASRKVGGVSGGYLDINRDYFIFKMRVSYDETTPWGASYGADEEEIISACMETSSEIGASDTYTVTTYGKTLGLRPVFSIKPNLLISSVEGEEDTYELVENKYKIEYYVENLGEDDEGYTLLEEYTKTGDCQGITDVEIKDEDILEIDGLTYDSENENNILTTTVKKDGSTTLKLYYSRNSYTKEIKDKDGNVIGIIDGVLGEEITLPTDLEKDGYICEGWYTDENFENKITSINAEDLETTTLYIKWIDGTHEVVLHSNDEIPETYEDFEVAGRIYIPKTNLLLPVLSDASTNSINKSVAILAGPGINKVGNTVIIGHNYRDGRFFANNKDIELGDIVYITDKAGVIIGYEVYDIQILEPENADYLSRETNGAREILLYSETDDTLQSLAIYAKEKTSKYVQGRETLLPTDIVKHGYAFDGWYDNAELTGTAITSISNTETENKEFFAKWRKEKSGDLEPGTKIMYDTGNPDIGEIECIVLYNDEQHGVQITPTHTLGTVTLGGETFEEAKESYNSAITILNEKAGEYFNSKYALDYRSIGSIATVDENGMFVNKHSESTAIQNEYYTEILTNLPQLRELKDEDSNYLEDLETLKDLNTLYLGEEDSDYWFASRKVGGLNGLYGEPNAQYLLFKLRKSYNNHIIGYFLDDEVSIIQSKRKISDVFVDNGEGGTGTPVGDQYYLEQYSETLGFRPVFSLKQDIEVLPGNGDDEPYEIGKKEYRIEYYVITSDDSEENYTLLEEYTKTKSGQKGDTVEISNEDIIEIDGFVFDSDNENNVLSAVIGDDETVLKLYYKKNTYLVTFKNEGQIVETKTVESGEDVTAPVLTKAGYTLSWDKALTNITSDIEINAIWTANTNTRYRIEYYLKSKNGEDYELYSAVTETKTGTTDTQAAVMLSDVKTFEGFTYDPSNANKIVSGNINGDESLVLKLYYRRNTYRVIYELNGGTASGLTSTYDYDINFTLPRTVTREGYTFEGWYDNPNCIGSERLMIPAGSIGDKTFYAKWSKIEQEVMLGDLNGDGKVTLIDLSLINQAIVGKISLNDTQKKAADINNDGRVSLLDLSLINQVIVGKITL